ncbi:MAG TPA: LysR family transcriptional regulator [Bordetella sp.]
MPLTRYTLRQFEAFTAVAESLGFATAGKRLGLSASAVSQLIAELESLLGFKLFERTTRRVELSVAGRSYLPSVLAVLRQVRQAELDAEALNNKSTSIIKIAAPQLMVSALLPAVIHAYMRDNPNAVVRLVDATVDTLFERIQNGEADVAVGPGIAATASSVQRDVLFQDKWALWCAPDSPIVDLETVGWAQLRETRMVTSWKDPAFEVARRQHTDAEIRALMPIELVDNISTAFGLARIDRSVVLAPTYVSNVATAMGLVHKPLVDPEIDCVVYLFRPGGAMATQAAQAFGNFLLAWMRANAGAFHGPPAQQATT